MEEALGTGLLGGALTIMGGLLALFYLLRRSSRPEGEGRACMHCRKLIPDGEESCPTCGRS